MDIIHGLSNLDIKTTHSSSHEEEKEVKRNWLELPRDVMFLIFLKLGTMDILCNAQWVCSSWWNLSQNPHLFQSIHVEEVSTLFGSKVLPQSTWDVSDGLARVAIDRSCGQLVEFSVRAIADDMLLHYLLAGSSSALRCVRLVFCHGVSEFALMEMAKKHCQWEKLEIIHCSFKTLGPFYSLFTNNVLKHLSLYLSELRHLNLVGCKSKMVTDDGLRAILDGCPHLESLDLRQCFNLRFEGDLKERCGNIKVLWLPIDTHDDYSKYDFHDEYNSYFRMSSDRDAYETEQPDYDTD